MSNKATTIVILGATGDLARRKLVPALFHLRCKGRLPQDLRILGFARTTYSDDSFRDFMLKGVQELGDLAVREVEWEAFARNIYFVAGDLKDPQAFDNIRQRILDLNGDSGLSNILVYLSIAPTLYEATVNNLKLSGLSNEDGGWRRAVIEKPFGRDLSSARTLNHTVNQVFDEKQVFRIDHFLGKETVQNLLVLRFGNAIFEPLWNRNYVDNVQITAAEVVCVGNRAGYYDSSGVVRDMVQNHLLQLLSMVAMEPPNAMDAESLRNKKVEALQAIRGWTPEEAVDHAASGQYLSYLDEDGVATGSKTPTYAALRLYVDNWRWQGVPFYLRSGKGMAEKLTEVVIQFRRPPHILFSQEQDAELTPNILAMGIQPDEGVHLKIEVKIPDEGMRMRSKDMEFHYGSAFKEQPIPEAYERLLQDALAGDTSLFIRSDQIEEAWRIVDPLLQNWESADAPRPHPYDVGSWGPEAAAELLTRDGRKWIRGCGGHGD